MHLRDVPSLGLLTDSEPPKGELYIKGNCVFKGYFKNPEITKLVLDEDGWLRLGDAGVLNKNGSITIIERIGEMKKLQNGYFIAPQKLENIYTTVPMINQIYVDVNSNYNFCVAIVHLDNDKLLQFAEVNGLEKDVNKLYQM
jgi:long-chain acyl-CoA synthetase